MIKADLGVQGYGSIKGERLVGSVGGDLHCRSRR